MGFKTFIKRFQVEYLTTAVTDTFARFPLSVTCCAGAAILSILAAHDIKPLSDDDMLRALLFLGYALVFFTASRLYSEGRQLPRAREAAIMFAGGIVLLALALIPDRFSAMHVFIGAALGLSMLFAPYLGRNSTEDSVWYFNYLNGVSLAIAGLSTFILCLGLSAIIGSMDYLLYDMKLSGKIYGDIWIFGGTFFGPVMFMHQISRQFDFEKNECAIPAGIYFIANYLVVPLILIYMWVLYVYFIKIAVQWELPKGNLAYMVTGFGSLGAAARLAVFPMRDYGTKLLQQFYKYFYYILIVPILLLAIGLYTRLSQYGVTEDRYAIGVCLTWLTALTIWNLSRPRAAHIKHVPMALCLLFLFASVGPWGAVHVSTRSQLARLEGMLREAGVLHADGSVGKTGQNVPFELRKDISGTLDYFYQGKEKAIAHFVDPVRGEIQKKYKNEMPSYDSSTCGERRFGPCWMDYNMTRYVMEAWGMQYVSRWETKESGGSYKSFSAAHGQFSGDWVEGIAPYTYMAWATPNLYNGTWKMDFPQAVHDKHILTLSMGANAVVTAVLADGRSDTFELQPLADSLNKEKQGVIPEADMDKMTLHPATAGFPAELRISEIHGRENGDKFTLDGGSMMLLFAP